ncbi:hypothetical protein F5Y17DRAFT_441348 [Xylariaceae sp. FL0594]|nr:hypothetical protein F5Y17DRAFT_441348 [Xylariaceae sp. FL0594]
MAFLGEPSEEDIGTLCDICGIPRAEAIARLKANNNNAQNAMNEYLDDPDSSKYKWDESHFTTDREGEENKTGISFNIQAADELPPYSYVNSAAPTRPPSRTDNRSPQGTRHVTQEDADLARAIAESAAESGIKPQEVGIIDNQTNPKYFGPANRSEYDSDMWAMVPTKATANLEQNDPPPSNRKRDPDAPVFLRQDKDHRVGALLSIYSKIPLARNFLLRCGKPSSNYGHNTEWWKGKPILRQDVLARISNGEEIWGEDAHPDFAEELHRLMAFLDASERSYGNGDTIIETKAIDENYGAWMPDAEDRLFHALQDVGLYDLRSGIEEMMTTGRIMPVIPPEPDASSGVGEVDEDRQITNFMFLDIFLDYESYSCVDSLYDALDYMLWSSAVSLAYTFPDDAQTAVLLKPGEVLTLRLGSGGLVKPCEIPAVFYADRYMSDRKDLALHFQSQLRAVKTALKLLDSLEADQFKCSGQACQFRFPGLSQVHSVKDCSVKMCEYAKRFIERQKRDAQWRQFQHQWETGTPYSMNDLHSVHTWSGPAELAAQEKAQESLLEQLIQDCTKKIEDIEEASKKYVQTREDLKGYLDVVRKRLTCTEDEADDDLFVFRSNPDAYRPEYWNPSQKYLLRGVATTHELAYVCVRDEGDKPDPAETTTARDQWWKIGYVKTDASPIKAEKVTLDDVLQAAGTESRNPILVYASEVALNQERIPLPDALRTFVKYDNRCFQKELAEESSLREANGPIEEAQVQVQDEPSGGVTAANLSQLAAYAPPETRGKRKYSVGSSIATNGSVRSALDDVDFTFDEEEQFRSKGILEQLGVEAGFRSHTYGDALKPSAVPPTEKSSHAGNTESDQRELRDDDGQDAETDLISNKPPEMSERRGGVNPFLGQPGSSAQHPIELMDLDTEQDATQG